MSEIDDMNRLRVSAERGLRKIQSDFGQYKAWAEPQITQHGNDQARIRELEAALRETIEALAGSYDVEYLSEDEDSSILETLRKARNVLVPNAGLTPAETPAEQWPCPNCGNRMTHAMDCPTRLAVTK